MSDLLSTITSTVVTLSLFGAAFWLFSQFLRKPQDKTENLANFHCAHEPKLVNNEFKCEGFYPLIAILISQPLAAFFVYAIMSYGGDNLPYQIFHDHIKDVPVFVQVLLGLLVIDISLWIRHSFVHRYLWSFHAVHHCAQEITWLTAHRLHPADQIVMSVIDFVVLYVIGFSAEGMAIALLIKSLNNKFVHSNIVLDYPKPFKYIFVSPNMHRWHHATEKEAHDKNFCVVFAFVDYVMGTFYVPDNALPNAYGTGNTELDDVAHKNILQELWIPFKKGGPAASAADAAPAHSSDLAHVARQAASAASLADVPARATCGS